MNDSLTICDFLEQGGAHIRFFDMGRRVVEIPLDIIRRFEQAESPYPQPFLQFAWLGIFFQYHHKEDTAAIKTDRSDTTSIYNIWFIKLPLDEQGLLHQAARDDFLRHIIKTVDATLGSNPKKEPPQQAIDDNPYGFTPREDRMAVFHAKVSKQTGKPASQFYTHALDYFTGKLGYDQWNFVGLQGIADFVVQLDEKDKSRVLVNAIPQLPTIPFTALCSCLENVPINKDLTKAIATRVGKALKDNDAILVTAGIRGLSHSVDRATVVATINAVLHNPISRNVEVLAAIAGRAWETLENPGLRFSFLENLASCDAGQQAFDSTMADLLYMPCLRRELKQDIRNPECSEQLAAAVDRFLQPIQNI